MLVKSEFKGPGMMKYSVLALLFKLVMFIAFIGYIVFPFGLNFLEVLQASIDSSVWNIKELLTPIVKIILYFLIMVAAEMVFIFLIIMPFASKELNRRHGRW